MRVVHLSTLHRTTDDRITVKEARTLASAGHDVTVVALGPTSEGSFDSTSRLTSVELPPGKGRLARVAVRQPEAWRVLRSIKPDVCHFHDPELVPMVVALRRRTGVLSIYDAHEELTKQIQHKSWMRASLRPIGGALAAGIEGLANNHLDHVIAATPQIRAHFSAETSTLVRNYPRIEEFEAQPRPASEPTIVMVGSIAEARGLREMLQVAERIESVNLILAGPISTASAREMILTSPLYGTRVRYAGVLDRAGVSTLLGQAWVGLCLLHPLANYLESLPVKMFEYMAAGVPVIASDFPIWRDIVESSGAGILVDPLSVDDIVDGVSSLLEDADMRWRMSTAGRRAAETQYSWGMEEPALLEAYERLSR